MYIRYFVEKNKDTNSIKRVTYDDNASPIKSEVYPLEDEDYEMLNDLANTGYWNFRRIARLVWKLARLESAQKI